MDEGAGNQKVETEDQVDRAREVKWHVGEAVGKVRRAWEGKGGVELLGEVERCSFGESEEGDIRGR